MGSVMIGNFGIKNGVQTFRINGSKEDLYKILDECRQMDAKFDQTPNLLEVKQGEWTMLLKIKIRVGVGKVDKDT